SVCTSKGYRGFESLSLRKKGEERRFCCKMRSGVRTEPGRRAHEEPKVLSNPSLSAKKEKISKETGSEKGKRVKRTEELKIKG
ncbi:MAG: hypothetical protein ACLFN1_08135, partial [Bacteroidales bacterium]